MTITGLGARNVQQQQQADAVEPAAGTAEIQPHAGATQGHNVLLGNVAPEAINFTNDPARFGVALDKKIANLALKGAAKQRPWADTYWPTYQDGINHRWQNTGDFMRDLSPAEKFDAAFNGWDPESVRGLKPFSAEWGQFDKPFDAAYYEKLGPLAKQCSMYHGNKQTRDASAAGKLNSDGTAKSGKEEEAYGGIQTWWGLCHAWTPASIREKEPQHAVVHNGVTFEVSDIKALLIACYNSSNSTMIGLRNEDRNIDLDDHGRPKKEDARDINPGTYHLLLSNLLGRDGVAFIEDRIADFQVWNQPIAEYRTTQMDPISKADAAQLVGAADPNYPYDPQATQFFHVKTEVDYISESSPSTRPNADNDAQERTDPYEYLLEVDANGDVIGGEWLGSSRTQHPDFLWYPYKDGGVPLAPQVSLEQVRVLLEKSRQDAPPVDGGVKVEESVQLKAGETKELAPITVQNAGTLEFLSTGSGDLDTYVRIGAKPTFDPQSGEPKEVSMSMYEPGSKERKTLSVNAGDQVYVTMRGYEDNTRATLKITQLA